MQMLTYKQFIDDLRPLAGEAMALFDSANLHETPRFRKWRHDVTDLIERIEDLSYDVNCSIRTRNFDELGSYTYDPSRRERLAAFNRDLQDTINELTTLIGRFEKYGGPKTVSPPSPSTGELRWPEKITAAWLFRHAPIGLWLKFAGLLLAVLLAGITIGQSSLYHELMKKLSPDESRAKK